jgi:hypothetical protein
MALALLLVGKNLIRKNGGCAVFFYVFFIMIVP